jgi:hypothetical protein
MSLTYSSGSRLDIDNLLLYCLEVFVLNASAGNQVHLLVETLFDEKGQINEFNTDRPVKVHNDVNVAGWRKVVPYHGSEQAKAFHMELPGQLWLELCQNLLYFRELFHPSNLRNLTRIEIAHNVHHLCQGWAFLFVCLAYAQKLNSHLQFTFSSSALLLAIPCC